MDEERRAAIVAYCQDVLGETLRSVLAYERVGTAVEPVVCYVRDDVRDEYEDEALVDAARTVVEEVALEAISSSWLEHVHRFGDIRSTVRVFEGATVVHTWIDSDEGLSISVDTGAAADLESFARGLHARATGEELE